jgi:hypothetical protein
MNVIRWRSCAPSRSYAISYRRARRPPARTSSVDSTVPANPVASLSTTPSSSVTTPGHSVGRKGLMRGYRVTDSSSALPSLGGCTVTARSVRPISRSTGARKTNPGPRTPFVAAGGPSSEEPPPHPAVASARENEQRQARGPRVHST